MDENYLLGADFLSGTGYAKAVIPWRKTDFEMKAAPVVALSPATVIREGKVTLQSRLNCRRQKAVRGS